MSQARKSSIQQVCYWIGIAFSVACIALVLAGNTSAVSQLEHTRMPLSWLLGILAIVAFMAAEYFDRAEPDRTESEFALGVLQTEL